MQLPRSLNIPRIVRWSSPFLAGKDPSALLEAFGCHSEHPAGSVVDVPRDRAA